MLTFNTYEKLFIKLIFIQIQKHIELSHFRFAKKWFLNILQWKILLDLKCIITFNKKMFQYFWDSIFDSTGVILFWKDYRVSTRRLVHVENFMFFVSFLNIIMTK